MSPRVGFTMRLVVIVMGIVQISAWDPCPIGCQCSQYYKKVECKSPGMRKVPNDIPDYTEKLVIADGNFSSLRRENFSHFLFLRNLKELELKNCSIDFIDPNTFADLPYLTSLKLRYNNLVNLNFLEYVKTSELALDFNPLHQIDFSGFPNMKHVLTLHMNDAQLVSLNKSELTTLVNVEKLYLSNNKIQIADGSMFMHMTKLRTLSLHNNSIQMLPDSFLGVFERLGEIFLDVNPLHCNCEMTWFKDFYKESQTWANELAPSNQRRLIQATCFTPIYGHLNSINNEVIFKCQRPHMVLTTEPQTTGAGEDFTLTCIAEGDPQPRIIWTAPDKEQKVIEPSSNRTQFHNVGMWTIHDIPEEKRGHFTCTAENKAGNATSRLFIDIVHKGPVYHGGDIAGAIFGTLIITIIICAILIFLFIKYGRIKFTPGRPERDPEMVDHHTPAFGAVTHNVHKGNDTRNRVNRDDNEYIDDERTPLRPNEFDLSRENTDETSHMRPPINADDTKSEDDNTLPLKVKLSDDETRSNSIDSLPEKPKDNLDNVADIELPPKNKENSPTRDSVRDSGTYETVTPSYTPPPAMNSPEEADALDETDDDTINNSIPPSPPSSQPISPVEENANILKHRENPTYETPVSNKHKALATSTPNPPEIEHL
ncbi:unnamed protein product [Owenia fusiformis]|uniref:Uncharacterized protein n=1 Tax=Owenia fusiformis TaxID=6347 RepID=A0A8J1XII2_OWEFU|nr:unnamed protein product [Owenia fusiformis]